MHVVKASRAEAEAAAVFISAQPVALEVILKIIRITYVMIGLTTLRNNTKSREISLWFCICPQFTKMQADYDGFVLFFTFIY